MKSVRLAIPLAAFSGLALISYYAHGCSATRLLLYLSPFAFLTAAVLAFLPILRAEAGQRRTASPTFLAPLFVVALPFVVFPAAWAVVDALNWWRFPSFETLVARIEARQIPVSTNFSPISPEQAKVRLCDVVRAQEISNTLVVEFDTDVRGFPAYAAGFTYCSAERIPKDCPSARHIIVTQIRPHWFYFAQ